MVAIVDTNHSEWQAFYCYDKQFGLNDDALPILAAASLLGIDSGLQALLDEEEDEVLDALE